MKIATDTQTLLGQVLIRDLSFECIIGILPKERDQSQPLFIDMDMQVDFTQASSYEEVDYTVDYMEVSQGLTQLAQQGKFQLLETLATRALDWLFSEYSSVQEARIHIKKPRAVERTAYVGVQLSRSR